MPGFVMAKAKYGAPRFDVGLPLDMRRRSRRCMICREPLGFLERKVHRGACARARKTLLQHLRRTGRA